MLDASYVRSSPQEYEPVRIGLRKIRTFKELYLFKIKKNQEEVMEMLYRVEQSNPSNFEK